VSLARRFIHPEPLIQPKLGWPKVVRVERGLQSQPSRLYGIIRNFSKTPGDPLPNGSDLWYSIAP